MTSMAPSTDSAQCQKYIIKMLLNNSLKWYFKKIIMIILCGAQPDNRVRQYSEQMNDGIETRVPWFVGFFTRKIGWH
jgi:hypothetical protein